MKPAQVQKKVELMKAKYLRVVGMQASIEMSIKTDPTYKWATSQEQSMRFETASSALSEAMGRHRFNMYYMCNDVKSTKAEFQDNYMTLLKKIFDVDEPLNALAKEQARFQSMRQSHMANV